jgi:hypothetical protein
MLNIPVIAQAEVKTILKGTGENYKKDKETKKTIIQNKH